MEPERSVPDDPVGSSRRTNWMLPALAVATAAILVSPALGAAAGPATGTPGDLPAVDEAALQGIRDVVRDDPGFVGVAPVTSPDPHVAVLYEDERPRHLDARLAGAGVDVPDLDVRVHEDAEPTPLMTKVPAEVTDLISTRSTPHRDAWLGPGRPILVQTPPNSFVAGCSSSFVYADGAGDLYLSTAGHCVLHSHVDDSKDEDFRQPKVWICVENCAGGLNDDLVLDLFGQGPVTGTWIELGDVLYAQQVHKDFPDTGDQLGEDLGFVEIPDEHEDLVDASMPIWGGPHGEDDVRIGERVANYGQGVGYGDAEADARPGVGLFTFNSNNSTGPDEWWALHPAGPGDSGSPLISLQDPGDALPDREAVGILTHGLPPALTVGTLSSHAVQIVEEETGTKLRLVTSGGGLTN